jgi:tetratricopeptide (TPR) repeat protein
MRKRYFFLYIISITMAIIFMAWPDTSSFGSLSFENSVQDPDKLAGQHFRRAIDLLKQTQYQDAIAEYEKVINLLPDSEIALDARYWIGQSYFRMGKYEEALSIFQKLIQEYPASAIVPVTQLMITRVEKDKERRKAKAKSDAFADLEVIVDPKTGVEYHKIGSLTGRKDVVVNGKWLLSTQRRDPSGWFLFLQRQGGP